MVECLLDQFLPCQRSPVSQSKIWVWNGEFSLKFFIHVPNRRQLTYLFNTGSFWWICFSVLFTCTDCTRCLRQFSLFKQVAKKGETSLWVTCTHGRKLTSGRSAASASGRTTWANKINADVERRFEKRSSVQTLIRPYTKAVRPPVMLTALCYYRRCDRSSAHHRIYILITRLINGVALWLHLWHSRNLI